MNRRIFIKTILLSSGAVVVGPQALFSAAADKKTVKMLMLYNNTGNAKDFLCEWGLAVWVENRDTAVLFDTGQTPSMLRDNMKKLNIDPGKLSKIIISHNHVDHYGGLGMVLEKTRHAPEVFVPEDNLKKFQNRFSSAKLNGIRNAVQISENIWSTGSLGGFIDEQAMILVHGKTMSVVTGCAHPGIVEIVQKAKAMHPDKALSLVLGGFHMYHFSQDAVQDISDKLKKLGVKRIAPSHCTGTAAISLFKNQWGDNFIDFGAGDSMTS